ncbi:MAG: hypothetical protein E7120_08170 [Bacteroidales bacterium]|nr:hypothetical protein [Bacteroidales bacterium]
MILYFYSFCNYFLLLCILMNANTKINYKMKKFFILTALLAVFGLTSCEKEPSKAIVGTWEAVKMEATIAGIDMTMDMSEWKMKMEFTFNADGTGSMLLETEGNSEKSTFEYTVNGNLLSLVEGDETSGIPISFDKKTMVAEMSGEIFGLGDNGAKVKVYFEKK